MSSVSTLSLGEKLALKGQLFELRKKLNVIEMQNQNTETYSFHPELVTNYFELPDRDQEFSTNVARAEMQRVHKLELLKASVEDEANAELTFSPAISNKSRRMAERVNARQKASTEVGRRLYDRRKQMSESKDRRKDELTQFDPLTGQKLFTPLISSKSKTIVPSSGGDMGAHEFMYRDAIDREERLRQAEQKRINEANKMAGSYKLNVQSDRLLRSRAERETRALFEWLNRDGSGVLTHEQVLAGAEELIHRGLLKVDIGSGNNHHSIAEQVWEVLISSTPRGEDPSVDTFRTTGREYEPNEAEKKWGITDQTVGIPSFMQHTLPVMARAYLGAQFDHRTLYDTTVEEREDNGQNSHKQDERPLSTPQASGSETPSQSSYHIPRSAGSPVKTPLTGKRKPHRIVLKSDFPRSLISAKTAAIKVKKAPLGTTPTKASNPHATKQLTKSLLPNETSFSSADGEHRPVHLDDIPIHGKIPSSSSKPANPVISNQNEATIPSNFAIFKSFMTALASLLKTDGAAYGNNVDLSRVRHRTRADAEKIAHSRDFATFKPSIPETSKKLALSKEEREVAQLLQQALEDSEHADERAQREDKLTKQSNLEMLLERTRLAKEKKELNCKAILETQMQECTFKPQINKSPGQLNSTLRKDMDEEDAKEKVVAGGKSADIVSDKSSSTLGQIYEYDSAVPAHERLYAMKSKLPRSSRESHKTKEEIELEGCTFAPKLAPYKPEVHMRRQEVQIDADGNVTTVMVPVDPPVRPGGWQQSVDRLRAAAATRREPETEREMQSEELEKRYERSKRQFAEGPKEFEFLSDARIKERAQRKKAHSAPSMYVDVKLSTHKTANIPVFDGDDPVALARCFCKIYSFPRQAVAVLEEVIRQSMESNGLRIMEAQSQSESESEAGQETSFEPESEPEMESTPDIPVTPVMHGASTSPSALSLGTSDREERASSKSEKLSTSSSGRIRLRVKKDTSRTPIISSEEGSFFHNSGAL